MHKKCRPFPLAFALGPDAAAVFVYDGADDRKAQAGAFGGTGGFIWNAVKAFENAFQIRPSHTDAVIADVNLGIISSRSFYANRYLRLVARVFNGVVEQVGKGRLQLAAIADYLDGLSRF